MLAAAIQYHEGFGDKRSALDMRRRLAELKGYEDDYRKQAAAFALGNYLSSGQPDRARTYLWNAMTWWFNSGNGGDLGGRVTRAIDDLRRTRGEAVTRRIEQAPPPR